MAILMNCKGIKRRGSKSVNYTPQADRASVEKKLEKKLASAQIPARTKAQRKVRMDFDELSFRQA